MISLSTQAANDTKFNGIPLLQGNEGVTYVPPVIKGGLSGWVTCTQSGELSEPYTTTEPYTSSSGNGTLDVDHAAATLDFNDPAFNKDDLLKEDVGFYTTCCTCNNHYSIKFVDSPTSTVENSGNHYIFKIGIANVQDADDLVDAIIAGTNNGHPTGHYTHFEKSASGVLTIYDERPKTDFVTGATPAVPDDASYPGAYGSYSKNSVVTPNKSAGEDLFAPGVAYDQATQEIGDIVLQIDEGENAQMKIDLPNVSLSLPGVSGLSVTTRENTVNAISMAKNGVSFLSGERGRMGAYQNRLKHTAQHLGNKAENLIRSESQIRDVDMAEKMMSYTKNNILSQSAQAMLAQSNQVPQGVLQPMQ